MVRYGRRYEEHVKAIYQVAGTARFIEPYILEKYPKLSKNFMVGLSANGLVKKEFPFIKDMNVWKLSYNALKWITEPHPNQAEAEMESLNYIISYKNERREQYNEAARNRREQRISVLPRTIRPVTYVPYTSKGRSWHVMGQTLDRTHYLIRKDSEWETEYYAESQYIDERLTDTIPLKKDSLNDTDLRNSRLAALKQLRGKIPEPFTYDQIPLLPGESKNLPPSFFKMAAKKGILEFAGTHLHYIQGSRRYDEKYLYKFPQEGA